MKVKDLILKLQKENPKLMVVVDGYEGGYQELERVAICTLDLNVNTADEWWMGRHERGTQVDAVYLPRRSQ